MEKQAVLRWQIWLADSDPPIWRRFQVSDRATLHDLHEVLQRVMGWQNSHLHRFEIGRDRYASPQDSSLVDAQDSTAKVLADLRLKPGARLLYLYDFGDGWVHLLTLEDQAPRADSIPVPLCLDGERACPPENCGGMWGYAELLESLEDPDFEDDGGWDGFDPDWFDIEAVNQQLRQL